MKISIYVLLSSFLWVWVLSAVFDEDLKASYNFDPECRCRLAAHQSAVVGETLVIDGGSAIFLHRSNGSRILDLNPYIVGIDISKPFSLGEIPIIFQEQKPLWVSVVNRGSLWGIDNYVMIQGGHFYNKTGWDKSQYTLPKPDIPSYNIQKFSLETKKWENVSFDHEGGSEFHRTFGGASITLLAQKISYYLGGVITPRSAPDAPDSFFRPTKGMLVFNHTDQTLVNDTNVFSPNDKEAYWHGTIEHLKIGKGKGFLLALMAETAPANILRPDNPEVNDEYGDKEISFKEIKIYNLDTKTWSIQKTTSNVELVPRTRFCTALVRSNSTNTWEYILYGGQRRGNQTLGVDDVYVLTLPSFIWIKVHIPTIGSDRTEKWTRSHTYHAVGGQLLVVGGWNPGVRLESDVECSADFISIFDLNTLGLLGDFKPDSVYKTPQTIQNASEYEIRKNIIKPAFGNEFADPHMKEAFCDERPKETLESCGTPTPPTPPTRGCPKWICNPKNRNGIIALVVVAPCLIIGGVVLCLYRKNIWPFRRVPAPVRPDSDQASVRPGSDRASVRPDSVRSDQASVCPGSDQASVRPDSDQASVRPGSDRASVRPDSDRASMSPGSDQNEDRILELGTS